MAGAKVDTVRKQQINNGMWVFPDGIGSLEADTGGGVSAANEKSPIVEDARRSLW